MQREPKQAARVLHVQLRLPGQGRELAGDEVQRREGRQVPHLYGTAPHDAGDGEAERETDAALAVRVHEALGYASLPTRCIVPLMNDPW